MPEVPLFIWIVVVGCIMHQIPCSAFFFNLIYQCFLVIFIVAVQDMLSAKVQAQVQAQLGGIPVKT